MKNLLLFLFLIPRVLLAQNDTYIVDALVYPKVPEKIITVGGADSDIQGFTNEAIQTAVDALPYAGGTVKLSAGTFTMKAPVKMKSNSKLLGAGKSTILRRIDGFHSRFIIDADYNELKLTVE